jgi:hypothetical protein
MATFDGNDGWTQHDYFGTDGLWHDHDEDSSDDGYDAARDAYLTGDGPAFTSRQIEEDRAWAEECRRNGW